MNPTAEQNKRLVLEGFHTLFNKRDYTAAVKFWSPSTSSTVRTSSRGARDCSISSRAFRQLSI
jgi:hypothetical protein